MNAVQDVPMSLYRRVFILAAPMALQSVITFSVSLADNLMVGSLGELALSGVFVANQVQHVLHMLIVGLGAAMIILASQYWGRQDRASTAAIIGIALRFSVTAGALFVVAALVAPEAILRLFTNEAAVIQEGMRYFAITRFSFLFFSVTQVFIAAMRCVERVKIGLVISVITFFVNVTLNWILIFGNLGAPALGIQGAAIATLTARILETPIIWFYVRFIEHRLQWRLTDAFRASRELILDFFRYGFPVILGDILWGINIAVQGAIVGRLGAEALASVSMANVVFSMIGVAMFGTAGASAVIIGHTVGSGDFAKVKEYAIKLQILFLVIGVISGVLLFIVKDYVLLLYNVSDETLHLAQQFMTVLAVTIVGTSYQMSALTGIVRAGGSIHFVLVNDLLFIWLLVIPSALVAAFVLEAPPVVVFACLKSDQILKCFVAVVKVNRFKWMKNLTRQQQEAVTEPL